MFSSAAGGAHWLIAIHCPSLPFPSVKVHQNMRIWGEGELRRHPITKVSPFGMHYTCQHMSNARRKLGPTLKELSSIAPKARNIHKQLSSAHQQLELICK